MPFLSDLFEKCAEKPGPEYIAFLRIMYPEIAYNHGTVSSENDTEATSFLYKFITENKHLYCTVSDDDFPYEPDFVEETYVELDEAWVERIDSADDTIVRQSDVGYSYRDEFGEPEVVGYNLTFDINTVLAQPTRYKA